MKPCSIEVFVLLMHCKDVINVNKVHCAKLAEKGRDIHIISGLILNFEVCWDQKRGMDPLFCTTEVIAEEISPGISSDTICSISTSLATSPFSLTPRFRYLSQKIIFIEWSARKWTDSDIPNNETLLFSLSRRKPPLSVTWFQQNDESA